MGDWRFSGPSFAVPADQGLDVREPLAPACAGTEFRVRIWWRVSAHLPGCFGSAWTSSALCSRRVEHSAGSPGTLSRPSCAR